MTTAQILRCVHKDLSRIVVPPEGQLSVAAHYVETLDLLTSGPRGFLVILEWAGEESKTQDEQALGVTKTEIGIYVAANPGLPVQPGSNLWLSKDGTTLLDRVEAIRERVRSIELIEDGSTTREFDYQGARQVLTPDGLPLRAFRLEFTLTHCLPGVDLRPVNP